MPGSDPGQRAGGQELVSFLLIVGGQLFFLILLIKFFVLEGIQGLGAPARKCVHDIGGIRINLKLTPAPSALHSLFFPVHLLSGNFFHAVFAVCRLVFHLDAYPKCMVSGIRAACSNQLPAARGGTTLLLQLISLCQIQCGGGNRRLCRLQARPRSSNSTPV